MKQFSEAEIVQTYQAHVNKPADYYAKFERLPVERNDKAWRWEGHDFPRVWCVLDFQDWLEKHALRHFPRVLATCLADPELEFVTWDKLVVAEYDSSGRNDLHTLDLEEKDFDFIVFNQTLEHLYNPFAAVANLYRHLKAGGYLFTSVPTINIPHLMPFHYNGFTPMGLCMLMKAAGFEVVELGFWGNLEYIKLIFQTGLWPDYRQLWHDGKIANEPGRNAQCWILVRK